MFEKSEITRLTLIAGLAICCVSAGAQTIDEMADLAKKKAIAEMSKGLKSDEPAPVVSAPKKEVKPEEMLPPAPKVTAIYGPRPDRLRAEVSESGFRSVQLRIGERTPSGWIVESIASDSVTFAHKLPTKPEDQKPKAKAPRNAKSHAKTTEPSADKPAQQAVSQFKRVNVLWAPSAATATGVAGSGSNLPVPGQIIMAPQATTLPGGPLPTIPLPAPTAKLTGR